MLLPDRAGVRRCGLLDFQDAVLRPAELRSGVAARGRAARCPAALRDAMTERYLAAFPGARPRRLRALGRDPGGAAQLQDPRHLHPAVAARRQARLSRRISRGSGACSKHDLGATRPWRRSRLARPPSAARSVRRAAASAAERAHDRAAAIGDGAGGRARHAAAADHRDRCRSRWSRSTGAPCSTMRSTGWRWPASSASSSTRITRRRWSPRISPRGDRPRIEISRRGRAARTPAAASRRRCRCSARRSSSSTATCCGSTARIRACAASPTPSIPTRWTRCCCCSAR